MPKGTVEPFLFIKVSPKVQGSLEELETSLTMPVERSLRTVSNVIKMKSSTSSSGAGISLNFQPKTNMQMANFSVLEALQELEGAGILDMRKVKIFRFNPEADAILKFTLNVPLSVKDPSNLIKKKLKGALELTNGVAKVDIQGVYPEEFNFEITPSKIFEHKILPNNLSSSLSFENKRASIGEAPLFSKTKSTSIRSTLNIKDLDVVKNKVLKKGTGLTLDKVSTFKKKNKTFVNISHKNGQHTVFVELYQDPSVRIFDFEKNVSNKLATLMEKEKDFKSIKFHFLLNRAKDLKVAIGDVFSSLYIAIFITFLVVFIFLRKIGPTFIISLVIPTSILFVVAIIYSSGHSLNLLSLSGLILSIGLIVDNAIVVVEKIQQLKEEGHDKWVAAGKGAAEVAIPLLMSTLTTVIIFLPAAFIEDGDSFTDMLKAFQVPVISALFASYFIALFFVPIASTLEKKKEKLDDKNEMLNSKIISFFHFIQEKKSIVLIVVLVGMTFLYKQISKIEETDIEEPRDSYSEIQVKFNQEVKDEKRKEFFLQFEKDLIRKKSDLQYDFVISNYSNGSTSGSISLYPFKTKNLDNELKELDQRAKNFIKGYSGLIGIQLGLFGADSGGSDYQKKKTFYFQGTSTSKLKVIIKELKKRIIGIKGVTKVSTSWEERGRKGYKFIPNMDILNQYNLTLEKISGQVTSMMNTYSIEGLKSNGKEIETIIKIVPRNSDWNLDSLLRVRVLVGDGRFVPFGELGKIKPVSRLSSIVRKNGIVKLSLNTYYDVGLKANVRKKLNDKVSGRISNYDFPKGYGFAKNDSMKKILEMKKRSQFVVYLAIFLIYLLMASLFESPILPFSILFTVPLAIIFGLTGLYFLEFDLDPMARLGLIILVGIVVNNAIILIDVILKLRSEGRRRNEAIAIGCTSRLKAVFMTSATTIFGLLPVAIGQSKIMGIPYSSLGVCIISGMLFSTLITLILLPIVYIFFDDVESKIKSLAGLA